MVLRHCGPTIAYRRRRERRFTRLSPPRMPSWFCARAFAARSNSYSAFRENDRRTPTGLTAYLRERGFARLTLCGLATDYCVLFSALDAREAGFAVELAAKACRGIDLDGSLARAMRAMAEAGVSIRD